MKLLLNVILTEKNVKHIFQALSECGRVVRNINQSDDRFHLLLCTRKQWHPRI